MAEMIMEDWTIRRYAPADKEVWNDFVAASRNGTFLFNRGFMGYHSDRFADHSLMAYKNGKLLALLPAEISSDGFLHSHRGLTYGGWITPGRHFDANDMMMLFDIWLADCRERGIAGIDYKPLPWIYSPSPAQEDIYALFRAGASMTECNISTALVPGKSGGFNTLQKRNLRKAKRLGAEITDNPDIADFHALLRECLGERHGVAPVHSLEELTLLKNRFPGNIRLHGCTFGGRLQGAVCMFVDRGVAHCQYIASSPFARENGLLTMLFDYLIGKTYAGCRYFDFGISNEDHGRILNAGLLRQKASLGGSAMACQRFELRIKNGL